MTTYSQVVIDTNVLVALVDRLDKWHSAAQNLREALGSKDLGLVYFDPVINEAFSVLARRAKEQRRTREEISALFESLARLVPKDAITWVSSETRRFYDQVVHLIHDTSGDLNFHDALIALMTRSCGIRLIASFDRDFDKVEWLLRVETVDDVKAAFEPVSNPQSPSGM